MSKRYARQLHSADGLIAAVEQYGFLPFFRNEIHGFSIEELCPPELWFADDVDGPWEWKGPAARNGICLYGKIFNKKAELYKSRAQPRSAFSALLSRFPVIEYRA